MSHRGQTDRESKASVETDLSDVGLCALNVNEFLYNILLCLLLVKFVNSLASIKRQLRNVKLSSKIYPKSTVTEPGLCLRCYI